MPGPFPGMDPFLEDPADWQGTHNTLIAYISAALNSALPEPYAAFVEARCYIETPDEAIRPDVVVEERPYAAAARSGGAATMIVSDPALHFEVAPQEANESFINIRDARRQKRVVTTIELLSPANKSVRHEGQRQYLAKQRKTLASRTHLIEIDLLRAGRHTVAIPASAFRPSDRHDYLVCLHRAGQGMAYDVWLNRLRQRLPRITVPLDAGVADVTLDLQAVFDRNYDEGAYARKIDYTQDPVPPLSPDDAEWTDALLRGRGLRP